MSWEIHCPERFIRVGEDILNITDHTTEGSYNTELLEQHLMEFLKLKAG